MSLANGTLSGTVAGLSTTLDGIISSQTATSQSNIAGFNSAFDSFAAGQAAIYDGQEQGFWNSYLAATDSSATGLQGIYNSNVAAAETTRDGVLSSYPNVTYDPEILIGTPAFDALISGANSTLDSDLLLAESNCDSNVQGHLDAYDTAINGPGGAVATFNSLMDAANTTFDSAIQTADSNYDLIVDGAEGLYDSTVNGPGGLVDTFDTNVAAYQAVYDGAVALAESIRNGLIDSAVAAFESTVETAQQDYNDWLTGKAGTGVTRTTVVTHFQPTGFLGAETWNVTTTQTDGNGNSSTTSSVGLKSAPAATGTLMSSSVSSTTIGGVSYTVTVETYQDAMLPTDPRIGNVYMLAIQDRTAWMEQRLDDLAEQINDTLAGLRDVLNGQVAAANDAYNNLANDPTTGFATLYQNAISAASTSMGSNSATHYDNYQDIINPMMSDPMTTNWPAVYQATQDYVLNVQAEEVTYTNDVGGAFVAYVSAQRAADTNRDLQIVSAVDNYLQQAITAVDGYYSDALAELDDWMHDVTDIAADFDRQDAQEFANMESTINNAMQSLGLAENAANEGFAIAESNAALAAKLGIAGEVESFRNSEMAARISFMQTEASAAEGWENAYAAASAGWINDAANAQNQSTILATNAEEQLQNNLLADQVAYNGDSTTAFVTWANTVSNGVASQWATAMGGGSDVTAVANAWKNFDQSAASEWKNLADGEAGAFQAYGTVEATARKTAQQNVSAQNVVRAGQIAGELVAFNAVVAPAVRSARQGAAGAQAPWIATIAAVERTATNNSAAATNAYELGATSLARTASDGVVNATHGFMGSVIGDWTPYQQSVVTQAQAAQNARIGEFNTLATSSRNAGTQQAQSDRASWQTFASSAAPAEDGFITAWAADQKAQAVLGAVTQFGTTASQAPSDFASVVGQQRYPMPNAAMMMAGAPMTDSRAVAAGASTAALGSPPVVADVAHHTQNAAKPTVTVGAQGQIVDSNLSLWQRAKLKASVLAHPMSSERELAEAAGYAVIRTGQVMPAVAPVPEPTFAQSLIPVLGNAQYAGYHFQQGNYGRAAFYETMMVLEATGAGWLLSNGGNFGSRVLARIGVANLPYRTPVTLWVQFTRFFATRTGYQQVVRFSPIVTWLQRHGWEAHHWLIPNSATRVGSEGLRRIGQAGWNLFPLPAAWNRAISNGGAGYNATRALIGLSPVLSGGLGYGIGTGIYNIGAGIIGDDE